MDLAYQIFYQNINIIFQSMKLLALIFLIIGSLCSINPSQTTFQNIKIDLQKVKVEIFDKYWIVYMPCKSRVGDCVFQYTLLPDGWSAENNKVKIPVEETSKTVNYAISANIYDPTGGQVEKQFVIQIDEGQIKVHFKDDFYEQNQASPPIEQMVQFFFGNPNLKVQEGQESGQSKKHQKVPPQNSQYIETQNPFISEQKITRISGVPSLQQIQQIIKRGDIVEITKTIQVVITMEADCQAKIDYLNSVIGQLQNHIYHHKMRIQKGELLLSEMKKEVERLEGEMKKMEQVMKENNKQQMNQKMIKMEKEREKAFREYQLNEQLKKSYLSKMSEVKGKKYSSEANQTQTIISLQLDELELLKVNELLEQTLARKKELEERISEKKWKAEVQKQENNKTESQIEDLQKSYKEHSEKAVKGKFTYLNMEYEINIMKNEMKKADRQTDEMKERMETFEAQIQKSESTVDEKQLRRIKSLIEVLERNLPSVQKKASELYYHCTGLDQTKQIQEQASVIYLVRPNAFTNYVQKTYNVNYINPSQQQNLRTVSIFSPQWSTLYGLPYPGFGTTVQTNSISFSCSTVNDIISGFGKIESIRNGIIMVNGDDGNRYTLHTGICTRLQNTKYGLPYVGQQIFWKGKIKIFNTINLYLATFY